MKKVVYGPNGLLPKIRLIVAPLLLAGCAGGVPDMQKGPLGWSGPIDAREVRHWTAQDLLDAPRWEMVEPPAFVVVPDSVWTPDGKGSQRYFAGAVVTADDKVVLLTDPREPDSILLHIVDALTGGETRVPAPVRADGEPLVWADLTIAAHDDGVVLLGSRPADSRIRMRTLTEGVWFATADGGFERPSDQVDLVGPLKGVLSDGSLVVVSSGWTGTDDTTLFSSTLIVEPAPEDTPVSRAEPPEVVFEIAIARDPDADYPVHFFWAHDPRVATGVAGDTIWTLPTDRPELVGLDPTGEVLLKVEWETGDRTIPANASAEARGALRRLTHFPAAKRLIVGANGLVHIQRVAWRDGQPRVGPEWLVFNPAGNLVARMDIPRNLEVMAFGPESVVTKARDKNGVVEIRVYTLNKPTGG